MQLSFKYSRQVTNHSRQVTEMEIEVITKLKRKQKNLIKFGVNHTVRKIVLEYKFSPIYDGKMNISDYSHVTT
jgi:hypothetical protein